MFKRMFQFSSSDSEAAPTSRNGSAVHPAGIEIVRLSNALQRDAENAANGMNGAARVPPAVETFDEVYALGGIKPATQGYSILKVAEMLSSKHLAEMNADLKRNALMMALEAAAAEIGSLLQDAVARNRALDEYEEQRQEHVKRFEAVKAEENNKLHGELERITSQYMTKIQANADQVAQEQDSFRAWQRRKQQESQRITDAATFCVPQGNGNPNAGTLAAVLERVAVVRR